MDKRLLAAVSGIMAQADCLVLPNRHDTWGAAVSKALMARTPVNCSEACRAAGAVRASQIGGIFPCDRSDVLRTRLPKQLKSGPITAEKRLKYACWASALGAEARSRYILDILDHTANRGPRLTPPWDTGESLYVRDAQAN
jgi:hypothetical protein